MIEPIPRTLVASSPLQIVVAFAAAWETAQPDRRFCVTVKATMSGDAWVTLWFGPLYARDLVNLGSIRRCCIETRVSNGRGLFRRRWRIEFEADPACMDHMRWIFDGLQKDLDAKIKRRDREIQAWKEKGTP